MTNWYSELIVYETLSIPYEPVVGKYKVSHLMSATYLLNPTVTQYSNIVIDKQNVLLYDVSTEVQSDGKIKLFGRIFESITPYVKILTKEQLEENYIILARSNVQIRQMLKKRSEQKMK